VSASDDFAFLVVSNVADPGSAYRWLVNGKPVQSGRLPQLFLLHADEGLATTCCSSIAPATATR